MIMEDKSRGLNYTTMESANSNKRMHILTARAVSTADAPQWAQEMINTMQQGFNHIEESIKSLRVGMNCL
jgi:hypothetical protein